MEDRKYDKILEGIQELKITQAVTHEKLSNMSKKLEETNMRLNSANKVYEKLEKRVDVHDKIAGAIALAVVILGTLVKFKVI